MSSVLQWGKGLVDKASVTHDNWTTACCQPNLLTTCRAGIPGYKLPRFAGACAAKVLSGIDHGDWQDASASVKDHALQAAVADGIVTFVHAAAGMQEKQKQDGTSAAANTVVGSVQQDSVAGCGSKENRNPGGVQQDMVAESETKTNRGPGSVQHVEDIDDVTCLELE